MAWPASAVCENCFDRLSSVELQVVGLCPVCYMIKFRFSTRNITGRNHDIGYVSSAYLWILLPGVTVDRSDAQTTNDTGPMTDPCMMLAEMYWKADKSRDAFVQMQWCGWPPKPLFRMRYHAEFGCHRSNHVRISRGKRRLGTEGVADHLKHPLPHVLPRPIWSFFFKECTHR